MVRWEASGPRARAAAGWRRTGTSSTPRCPAMGDGVSSPPPAMWKLPSIRRLDPSAQINAASIRDGETSSLLRRSGPAVPGVLDRSREELRRTKTQSPSIVPCVCGFQRHAYANAR